MAATRGNAWRFTLREISGACGDLGTLLPLTLAMVAVGGLELDRLVGGLGLFYIVTALLYRLPIPVQPMKAVAAVVITTGVGADAVLASGVIIGVLLIVLGTTGWIDVLARRIPAAVASGLQLGLGLALGRIAFDLMAAHPVTGLVTLAVIGAALWAGRIPAALAGIAVAVLLGWAVVPPTAASAEAMGATSMADATSTATGWLRLMADLVLPQLSLTVINAIVLTAVLAKDRFGARARHVTSRRLALSSGVANLLLTPLGAMPMCHGAGGLAAHHRFGARSGGAPLTIGCALLASAVLPAAWSDALYRAIPAAGLGALLLVAACELAFARRLRDSDPASWAVIGLTALVTLWVGPLSGLIAGLSSDRLRALVGR